VVDVALALLGFVGLVAGVDVALQAKTSREKIGGGLGALVALTITLIGIISSREQGQTIQVALEKTGTQQSRISTLEREHAATSKLMLDLVTIMRLQETRLSQQGKALTATEKGLTNTTGAVNHTTDAVNHVIIGSRYRTVDDETARRIEAFARAHQAYHFRLFAQPGAEDADHAIERVRIHLANAGVDVEVRTEISLREPFHRTVVMTSNQDGAAAGTLVTTLKRVDPFVEWVRRADVPRQTVIVAMGDRG
jgi:hypothetical protein